MRPAARANASRGTRGTRGSPPCCGTDRGILAFHPRVRCAGRWTPRAGTPARRGSVYAGTRPAGEARHDGVTMPCVLAAGAAAVAMMPVKAGATTTGETTTMTSRSLYRHAACARFHPDRHMLDNRCTPPNPLAARPSSFSISLDSPNPRRHPSFLIARLLGAPPDPYARPFPPLRRRYS